MTVGLLVLADLGELYTWSRHRGPGLAELLGAPAGDLLPPTFDPPAALVLVIAAETPDAPLMHRGWLARAAAIVLVLDASVPQPEADDPVFAELLARELADAHAALPNIVATVHWDGRDPAVLRDAITTARDHAPTTPTLPSPPPRPRPAVAPGPWLAWSGVYGSSSSHRIDLECMLTQLNQGLCTPGGRPTLVSISGDILDLLSGERRTRPPISPLYFAMAPDGERVLIKASGTRDSGWQILRPGAPPLEFPGPWGRPIQWDPFDRAAWIGHRCRYYWLSPSDAYWTPSEHAWPCGHGKKLWGYEDNDPLWIHLAPDASTILSVYGHDALLTPGLPLRWRSRGDFVLGLRDSDPWRVLIHGHDPAGFPGDPHETNDEDARHMFSTVVLGPDAAHRYAVSLEHETWRILGETASKLGGPEPAWLLLDRDHNQVRRGSGRLLAGWHEHAVILEQGHLWREHLMTGTRTDLGPAERPIDAAVALAGSPNVVLLHLDGPHVRLV